MKTFLTLCLAWCLGGAPAVANEADPRRTPVVLAVERAAPAVVTITVEVQSASPFMRFGGAPRTSASEGSGVVIAPEGVVLTNAHVIDGAQSIDVLLQDGRHFDADVVAQDLSIDLAVLRIRNASNLPTIPLGDSSDLFLGEPAIAIGNPYGLGLTVSTGVVASTSRDVSSGEGPTQSYIQTDAAINPGNSGGALVNIHGQLIGINTFIHTAAEGIGFAIPANRARKIADDLLLYGAVQVAWLGCDVRSVSARRLGGVLAGGAVVIERVVPGGPADQAGLRRGDLLYELDGHATATRSDLNARLAERASGDRVAVSYVRGEAAQSVQIKTSRPPQDIGQRTIRDVLQIELEPVQGALRVMRAGRTGSWLKAGLRPGDVIMAVDGARVSSASELARVIAAARGRHRSTAWFTVFRSPYRGSVEIEI